MAYFSNNYGTLFFKRSKDIAQEVVDVVYGSKLVGNTQCKH